MWWVRDIAYRDTKDPAKIIPNRISIKCQYVTLQKYFSHPSFSYVLTIFPTPPIKLKLRLSRRWETTKSSQPTWTNQTIYPIRNREQSINTSCLRLLDSSRALKAVHLFRRPSTLPVDSMDCTDQPPIQDFQCRVSHTERWWRCSKCIWRVPCICEISILENSRVGILG
jgi:hypothetical protein